MAKKEKEKPQVVMINGEEYKVDDLLDEQKVLFNHCADLDNKIARASFNLQQLQMGKEAIGAKLVGSLGAESDKPEA